MSPHSISAVCFAALLVLSTGSLHAAPAIAEQPLQAGVEFTPRKGLPNFFAKLNRGEAVRIAYLGGSITAEDGWRVQSRAWLQKQFPVARIDEINATIGGTGSDLGVFRLENDALSAHPDLFFVEFAVNDDGTRPDRIMKAMEGIVRKTWRALPQTDICFVYTVTAKDTPALAKGRMKRSESAMEAVANHYAIPSVHLGIEVARLEKEGKLVMKSNDALPTRVSGDELDKVAALATDRDGRILFSKDGIHPYPETGHVLYTQALVRAFDHLRTVGKPALHALGAPLVEDNWETARQIVLDHRGVAMEGPVTKRYPAVDNVAEQVAARLPSLWRFAPGATLKFKFRGTKVSIYDLLGPDGAMLEITLDGNSRRQARFDGYCTYHRLSALPIAEGVADSIHEVVITVLPDAPDKANMLFERNRADFEKFPAKYTNTVWHAGAILVVGDVVE